MHVSDIRVIKRDGTAVEFEDGRILNAIRKAYEAVGYSPTGSETEPESITQNVIGELLDTPADESGLYPAKVEAIQDIVEKQLVAHGLYEVSKAYILYRESHRLEREARSETVVLRAEKGLFSIIKRTGDRAPFDPDRIRQAITQESRGMEAEISIEAVSKETLKTLFDGMQTADLDRVMAQAASTLIEKDPAYASLAARLLLRHLYRETLGIASTPENRAGLHAARFERVIEAGIIAKVFSPGLAEFDLSFLASRMRLERDDLLEYLGVQTLHERYCARIDDKVIETPQMFWMRVAMGLAIGEAEKNSRAAQFYDVLSTLRFVASTPTLFHSGLTHPQLSSCYVSTVKDDLAHIFKVIGDNAQLSKWSGGIGNDWTAIRATGAQIKSTKVKSQGVIPFLKISNDATVAINRSGKRRGAACAYLETWHLDIEDFLDLRRNTGDERRRTHDMNTANWIPDLFMKRVRQEGNWTLFSPDEVPDLHETYGAEFEARYEWYEAEAVAGRIRQFRTVEAVKLWRKMLARLFETGHPWITFKDPCNIRSPQDHAGVIHNSNLCTEITLNNSEAETAVCNLGSVNLAVHIAADGLDEVMLADTVTAAMRMLDNVIDINFYPTEEARISNMRHRPVGLGIMGFQDALFSMGLGFDDDEALEFADRSMEMVSYYAILASAGLAEERGAYPSYPGSKWDRGILPLDTLDLLDKERGETIRVDRKSTLDWDYVRDWIRSHGMRNSNTMAIAPTATISTIAGCLPCIEPIYKNIYVKSNMSGEFTIVNRYLIDDLKKLKLWDETMLKQLKVHDGSVQRIDGIPDDLKRRYKEAFEIDSLRLIEFTAVRGKWVDQSQSHNVFMRGTSGQLLHRIYMEAWERGLKTTYYLRTLAASQIEKSTLEASYGFTQKRYAGVPSPTTSPSPRTTSSAEASAIATFMSLPVAVSAESGVDEYRACRIEDPECESCQ